MLPADSVGPALPVVPESPSPAERPAFVSHDMFGMPFEQIAPIVDRTPGDHQEARRPRPPIPTCPISAGWWTRSWPPRGGDFAALVPILDPDVMPRADGGMLTGG
ncbi:hypothetical protein HNP84_005136 [Thermocatellispora tengchongensis]|uniref:Uncharacterized protein n=1 Tax=Thermocatellispora tengchongensis TaxID=1073253 RepID=A0A840P7X5_9ACTN|nr:hypothetical protein [Thermocatellispora tengchongensis]MBB5135392.1 hypothetical protein [Thermocatellispora tengchongensis]